MTFSVATVVCTVQVEKNRRYVTKASLIYAKTQYIVLDEILDNKMTRF